MPQTLEQDELREMVEKPARAVGLALEEKLADVIVREAMEATSQEEAPVTILPLLEFALTELWKRRKEGLLTHAAYQDIGGVTGGLTQWADGILSRLDEKQRRLARRVLTDLVHPGDERQNIPDSRRRQTLDELCRHEEEREAVHQIVRILADARLLVTGRDLATGQETVELIHDALLRKWGQLHGWLQEDRTFRRWQDRIRDRVKEWQDKGRDKGLLLSGAALAEAQDWLAQRPADIEDKVREFIRLSTTGARWMMRGYIFAALFSLLLALLAFWQADMARHQRDVARARQWAAVGQDSLDRLPGEQGAILGLALGVESIRLSPSLQADQLLREGLSHMARKIARMTHDWFGGCRHLQPGRALCGQRRL
ncbi:MAG: hypothetical protein H5U01_00055 [Clostridia bacterium]|nr:hypothetical protein [Clostridia bacterium]